MQSVTELLYRHVSEFRPTLRVIDVEHLLSVNLNHATALGPGPTDPLKHAGFAYMREPRATLAPSLWTAIAPQTDNRRALRASTAPNRRSVNAPLPTAAHGGSHEQERICTLGRATIRDPRAALRKSIRRKRKTAQRERHSTNPMRLPRVAET